MRLALISAHYRRTLDFSENLLKNAEANIKKIRECLNNTRNSSEKGKKKIGKDIKLLKEKFEKAMDDDFNTPEALKHLYAFINLLNKNINNYETKSLKKAENALKELLGVLGINVNQILEEHDDKTEKLMKIIIKLRKEARAKKDYYTSDRLRKELSDIGIQLKDLDNKTVWDYK